MGRSHKLEEDQGTVEAAMSVVFLSFSLLLLVGIGTVPLGPVSMAGGEGTLLWSTPHDLVDDSGR